MHTTRKKTKSHTKHKTKREKNKSKMVKFVASKYCTFHTMHIRKDYTRSVSINSSDPTTTQQKCRRVLSLIYHNNKHIVAMQAIIF